MDPVQSERLKSIFFRAAELAGPEREAALTSDCAGDLKLRRSVEELLAQHDETGSMEILPREAPHAHTPTLVTGRLISKRFRILRFIGKGGMGEVYEASDEELGGQLALKMILPGLIQNEEMLARFRREVQLARQVTHPNVCRIFDVGRDKIAGTELLYLTMELIDGETLTEYLKRQGKLRPADALPLLRQMAAGLRALHEKNIVHRDLKPSNVMLVRAAGGTARAVIGDFGLARAVLEESSEDGLSRSGLILGTPGYMAPEQLAGMRVSAATDVFAFGVVAYEMVTGKRAFPVRNGNAPPPAPREVSPELPSEWERVILRCMEPEPGRRPESAEAATDVLEGQSKLPRAKRATGTSRRGWWIGAAAALVLAGLAPWAWQASRRGPVTAVGRSANAAYLEAADLLDHAYRPGAVEKAIQLLEPVSAAPGAPALVHAALGRAYFRQFRVKREAAWLEKARASGERAVELDAKLAGGRVLLGRVYTESGKSDLAAQELQAAMLLDARNAEAFLSLAELYEKQGRTADIEPNLRKAVDLAPDYWGAHATLGLYLRKVNRLAEARQEFERLIELAPDNKSAYNYVGLLNLQENRYPEARSAFEKELALAPSSSVYSNLGLVKQLEGDYDGAARMFQQAIDLNPGDFRSWGNLGSAYQWNSETRHKAPDAYRKAIELAEKARKTSPNNVEILARLGGIYASVGDARKSVPLLRQAVALDGGTAATAYRVGEAYELLQQRDEALRWIGTALKLGYSPEDIKRNPYLALLRKDPRFKWARKQ